MKATAKKLGFMVFERTEQFEQPLGLDVSPGKPDGGILTWTDDARAVFSKRTDAVQAVIRTEYYRLAFSPQPHPQRSQCVIVPVEMIEITGEEAK